MIPDIFSFKENELISIKNSKYYDEEFMINAGEVRHSGFIF